MSKSSTSETSVIRVSTLASFVGPFLIGPQGTGPILISQPLYCIVLILLLPGFGFALLSSADMNAIMGSVDEARYGLASGTGPTMLLLGQMVGMATATLMFEIFMGRAQIGPENLGNYLLSFQYTLLIFFACCVVGIFFSLLRGDMRQGDFKG